MEAEATTPIQSKNHREDLNFTYICNLKNTSLFSFLLLMTELGSVAGSFKRLRCVFAKKKKKKKKIRQTAAVVKLPSLFLLMILFQKQCEMVIKEVARVQADSCLGKGH